MTRNTWGAPDGGWPVFGPDGRIVRPSTDPDALLRAWCDEMSRAAQPSTAPIVEIGGADGINLGDGT